MYFLLYSIDLNSQADVNIFFFIELVVLVQFLGARAI